jgi:diguanylate cyclase (GGDEF)-like protein
VLAGRIASGAPFTAATLECLDLAARALASILENAAKVEALEQLAFTDALTHVPNYRFLRVALDAELARAARRAETFTVVMVDVDNLKRYNAEHGHLAGSELLQEVARLLRISIRATDVVAKYGGDEFVLILPRTPPEGGLVLSERIRKKIAAELRGRVGERLSCSFGVAAYPIDGTSFETLISAADRALYCAKRRGRNRVVVTEALGSRGVAGPSQGGPRRRRRPPARSTTRAA